MKRFVLFIGLLYIGASISAQNSGRITGKIVDQETKDPVPQANVRILQQQDSLYINGVASDQEGDFAISLPFGNYIIHITYVGHHDYFRNVIISNTNIPKTAVSTLLPSCSFIVITYPSIIQMI